jgi:bifunctional DNase/RNase
MEILGLSSSPSSGGAYALILNEINGSRRLPIIIGTYEAQAIALELEHIKPPRPMTHDLLVQLVRSMDAVVESIYVNALSEGTFYAQIVLADRGVERIQDARPSDAIAVAVRFGCPIYVDDKVLEEAGIIAESSDTETVSTTSNKDVPVENLAAKEDPLTTQALKAMNEIEELEKSLNKAISDEDYEKAAQLRDQLNRLKS